MPFYAPLRSNYNASPGRKLIDVRDLDGRFVKSIEENAGTYTVTYQNATNAEMSDVEFTPRSGGSAFDLHDDVPDQQHSFSDSDRLLVTEESAPGDPQGYSTIGIMRNILVSSARVREVLNLTVVEAPNIIVDATISNNGGTLTLTENDGDPVVFTPTTDGGERAEPDGVVNAGSVSNGNLILERTVGTDVTINDVQDGVVTGGSVSGSTMTLERSGSLDDVLITGLPSSGGGGLDFSTLPAATGIGLDDQLVVYDTSETRIEQFQYDAFRLVTVPDARYASGNIADSDPQFFQFGQNLTVTPQGGGVLVTAAPSSAVLDAAGADFPAADSDCDHELAYDRSDGRLEVCINEPHLSADPSGTWAAIPARTDFTVDDDEQDATCSAGSVGYFVLARSDEHFYRCDEVFGGSAHRWTQTNATEALAASRSNTSYAIRFLGGRGSDDGAIDAVRSLATATDYFYLRDSTVRRLDLSSYTAPDSLVAHWQWERIGSPPDVYLTSSGNLVVSDPEIIQVTAGISAEAIEVGGRSGVRLSALTQEGAFRGTYNTFPNYQYGDRVRYQSALWVVLDNDAADNNAPSDAASSGWARVPPTNRLVPAGGAVTQVMGKGSATDFDTEWVAAGASTDLQNIDSDLTSEEQHLIQERIGALLADQILTLTYGIAQDAVNPDDLATLWAGTILQANTDIVIHRARMRVQPGFSLGYQMYLARINWLDSSTYQRNGSYEALLIEGTRGARVAPANTLHEWEGTVEGPGFQVGADEYFMLTLRASGDMASAIGEAGVDEDSSIGFHDLAVDAISYVAKIRAIDTNPAADHNFYHNNTFSTWTQIDYSLHHAGLFVLEDEGASVYEGIPRLNCTGPGVACSDENGVPTINVTGGGGGGSGDPVTVRDQGTVLTAQVESFNFTGGGITCTEPTTDNVECNVPANPTQLTEGQVRGFITSDVEDFALTANTATQVPLPKIPNLPATRTTSGTFNPDRIPALPASRIASGTFADARLSSDITRDAEMEPWAFQADVADVDLDKIPNLPAARITSGILDTGRIPDLSATKITSDVLAVARIPDLDASQITTGTFDDARIADEIARDSELTIIVANPTDDGEDTLDRLLLGTTIYNVPAFDLTLDYTIAADPNITDSIHRWNGNFYEVLLGSRINSFQMIVHPNGNGGYEGKLFTVERHGSGDYRRATAIVTSVNREEALGTQDNTLDFRFGDGYHIGPGDIVWVGLRSDTNSVAHARFRNNATDEADIAAFDYRGWTKVDDGFDTSTDIGHDNQNDSAYYQLINFTTDLAVSVVEPQPPGTDGETIDRLLINGEPYNLAGGAGGAAELDELLSRVALVGNGVSGRYYELGHPGTIADTDLLQIVGSGAVGSFMSPMIPGKLWNDAVQQPDPPDTTFFDTAAAIGFQMVQGQQTVTTEGGGLIGNTYILKGADGDMWLAHTRAYTAGAAIRLLRIRGTGGGGGGGGTGEENVQADWNETSSSADAFIRNKPNLGTAAALDIGASAGHIPILSGSGDLPESTIPESVALESEVGDAFVAASVGGAAVNMTFTQYDGTTEPVRIGFRGRTTAVNAIDFNDRFLLTDESSSGDPERFTTALGLALFVETNIGEITENEARSDSASERRLITGRRLATGINDRVSEVFDDVTINGSILTFERYDGDNDVAITLPAGGGGGGGEVNVQSDWNETSSSDDSFIRNKPAVNNAFVDVSLNVATLVFTEVDGGTESQVLPLATQTQVGLAEYANLSEGRAGVASNRAIPPVVLHSIVEDWAFEDDTGTIDLAKIPPIGRDQIATTGGQSATQVLYRGVLGLTWANPHIVVQEGDTDVSAGTEILDFNNGDFDLTTSSAGAEVNVALADNVLVGASVSGGTLTLTENDGGTITFAGGSDFDLHNDVPGLDTDIASADRIVFSNEGTSGDPNAWASFEKVFDGIRDVVGANNSVPADTDRIYMTDESASGDPLEWVTVSQLEAVIGGTHVAANPSVDDDDPEIESITVGNTDYAIGHPHRGLYDDTRNYQTGDIVSTGSGINEIFWVASEDIDAGEGQPSQLDLGSWWSIASHGFWRGNLSENATIHAYPGDTWIYGDSYVISLEEVTSISGQDLGRANRLNGIINLSEKLQVFVNQSRAEVFVPETDQVSFDGTGLSTRLEAGIPTIQFGFPWISDELQAGRIALTTSLDDTDLFLTADGTGLSVNKVVTVDTVVDSIRDVADTQMGSSVGAGDIRLLAWDESRSGQPARYIDADDLPSATVSDSSLNVTNPSTESRTIAASREAIAEALEDVYDEINGETLFNSIGGTSVDLLTRRWQTAASFRFDRMLTHDDDDKLMVVQMEYQTEDGGNIVNVASCTLDVQTFIELTDNTQKTSGTDLIGDILLCYVPVAGVANSLDSSSASRPMAVYVNPWQVNSSAHQQMQLAFAHSGSEQTVHNFTTMVKMR